MGINAEEAKAILSLRRNNAVGRRILCIGRPELFVTQRELKSIAKGLDVPLSDDDVSRITTSRFAEPLLQAAGFNEIVSLDGSPYEGAQMVHDLNQPIPDDWHQTADFIYDCGTSEHIFDVAQVFRNILALLKPGGTVLMSSPGNGQCGHGFYQFSPELFYRLFEANGFEHVHVYAVALMSPPRWFRVTDPKALQRRVQFQTSEPVQLLAVARRAGAAGPFVTPQQSDYAEAAWQMSDDKLAHRHGAWRANMARAKAALKDRALFPAAVVARHLTGFGMPGLWRAENFRCFDPLTEPLIEPVKT